MGLQQPDLTQDQWSKRLYDLQIGTLYPVHFSFIGDIFTDGTPGDSGAFYYFQQVFSPSQFVGIAGITPSIDVIANNAPATIIQVSFAPIPTLADSTDIADDGNIILQKTLYHVGALRDVLRKNISYYPGVYPVHSGQNLYINYIAYGVAAPITVYGSCILHTLQTGVQV